MTSEHSYAFEKERRTILHKRRVGVGPSDAAFLTRQAYAWERYFFFSRVKRSLSAFCSGTRRPQAWRNMQTAGFRCRPCAIYVRLLFSVWQFPA